MKIHRVIRIPLTDEAGVGLLHIGCIPWIILCDDSVGPHAQNSAESPF
jgi:hypothetical protein